MKIYVTMKDPDTLSEAIMDGFDVLVRELMADAGLTKEEAEIVAEHRSEKMRQFAGKFFKWGEYLTVELDDTLETAKVVKVTD